MIQETWRNSLDKGSWIRHRETVYLSERLTAAQQQHCVSSSDYLPPTHSCPSRKGKEINKLEVRLKCPCDNICCGRPAPSAFVVCVDLERYRGRGHMWWVEIIHKGIENAAITTQTQHLPQWINTFTPVQSLSYTEVFIILFSHLLCLFYSLYFIKFFHLLFHFS